MAARWAKSVVCSFAELFCWRHQTNVFPDIRSRKLNANGVCCFAPFSFSCRRTIHVDAGRKSNNIYDVAVVGGGVMGSSSAYFLAKRIAPAVGRICVIERDPTYTQASTTLSVASIRQQFSLAENIQMSQYSFQFLSEIEKHLATHDHDPPDIQLHKGAYLFVCSKSGEATLKENYKLQREFGCDVALLSPDELKDKFPWLNTEDVTLSSIGTANEGWFDPWALLQAFKRKAISLGVEYVPGEAVDFVVDQKGHVSGIKVVVGGSPSSTQTIHCGTLINAGGPSAGYLAKMLGIYLPVEPRKRNVYVLDCPAFTGWHNMPLLVDHSGAYIRPETSGYYLCGGSPAKENDKESFDLEVDHDLFNERIWPIIANRIPAFECLKVLSAWAGYYEYNTLDQNAIIGRHPEVENLVFVNGFSGHGIQQCPAAGRAVSELILDNGFQTIDLSRLGYDRVLKNEPLAEKNVV